MLAPAFSDPVLASQTVFRAIMNAMARPGAIVAIGGVMAPPPLRTAAAAVALTLLDYETPIWLDGALARSPDVAQWFKFHTGAPFADEPRQAAFAFIADPRNMPDFGEFFPGTTEYPDRATTLVLQTDHLSGDGDLRLSGPGIKGTCTLSAAPLPPDFIDRMGANRAQFPRGLDVILAADTTLATLPRSVHVTGGSG